MSETSELLKTFQALVELTDAIHWEMDLASGKFTYVSPQIEKILGYSPGTWDTFEAWAATLHPDDREYAVTYCQEKTQLSEDHVFLYRALSAAGETVWLRDVVKVITEDGRPARLMGVMFDITAQKRAEAELRTQSAVLDNLAEGVCLVGTDDLAIKWVNPAFERIFGYGPEEALGLSASASIATDGGSHEDIRSAMVSALEETGRWYGEIQNVRKDGTRHWCQINASRLDHPEYGNVYVLACTESTERKRTEEALRDSERRYRTIIDSSPIGIVVCDSSGQVISTNRAMADTVGATQEQIMQQNYHTLESWRGSGLYEAALRAVETGETQRVDTELVSSFGKPLCLSAYFTPFASGELLAMMQDISELLLTQKELARALHDKNILMKEIQHRTKNNLFILQSLLSLQAREIRDEQARECFSEAKTRVTSMAVLYDILNRSTAATKMSSSEYIRKLVDTLFFNCRCNAPAIRLQYDIEDITLDVDTLMPLGLIVNELVTNAFKYAFPDGMEGVLSVSLKATGKGAASYELIIKDTGAGLPEGFEVENSQSLGLEIVTMLVKQLNGTLRISKDGGAAFSISFTEKLMK